MESIIVNQNLRLSHENPRYSLLQGPISFGLTSEGRRRRFEVYHKVSHFKRGSNEFKIQWRQNGITDLFFSSGELAANQLPTRMSYGDNLLGLAQKVFVPWIQAFCDATLIEAKELKKETLVSQENVTLKTRSLRDFYLGGDDENDDEHGLEARSRFYLEQVEFLRDLALTCQTRRWTKNYPLQYRVDLLTMFRPCRTIEGKTLTGFLLSSGVIDFACRC